MRFFFHCYSPRLTGPESASGSLCILQFSKELGTASRSRDMKAKVSRIYLDSLSLQRMFRAGEERDGKLYARFAHCHTPRSSSALLTAHHHFQESLPNVRSAATRMPKSDPRRGTEHRLLLPLDQYLSGLPRQTALLENPNIPRWKS